MAGAGRTVVVRDQRGERFDLPEEQLAQATSQGYRVETPEEASDADLQERYGSSGLQTAAAAGEAIARGASLGLSDLLLTKTGAVSPEALRERKERNPVASTTGEIAGGVGALFVPGLNLGTVGRGAAAVTKEALGTAATRFAGKLLTAGAAGAAEGAFYGAGNAVSESVLGETELTAQKLLAGAGLGALLGGAGGGLAEMLDAGAQRALKAAAKKTRELPADLLEEADVRTLKASGAIQSDLSKLSFEKQARIAQDLRQLGIVTPGASVGDIFERAGAAKKQYGQTIGDVLDAVDQATGGQAFDMDAVAKRIQRELGAKAAGNPIAEQQLQDVLKPLEGASARTGFAKANEIKSSFTEDLYGAVEAKGKKRFARQVGGILNDEIESQLGTVAGVRPDLVEAFKDAKGAYGSMKEAEKFARKGVNRNAGNRFFSLTDQGLGAATGLLTGGPMGIAAGVAGAAVNKVLRERGSSFMAHALERASRSTVFDTVATAFDRWAKDRLAANPGAFGLFTPVLQSAAARSPEELLVTHQLLAQSRPDYLPTLQRAGLDTAEDRHSVGQRAMVLAAVQSGLADQDGSLAETLGAFLGGKASGEPAAAAVLRQALKGGTFEERSAALTQLAADPQQLSARLTASVQPLAAHAPQLAAALAATATNAVQFLAAKAPKPPDSSQAVAALRRPWKPSAAELASFERYVAAVDRPTSVVADLRAGSASPEAMEALQAVYPALYEDLRTRTLEALATHGRPISYRQRLLLGQLLQTPLDEAQEPAFFRQLQENHLAPVGSPGQGGGGHGGRLQIAAGDATEAQRLEGRRALR